MTFSALREGLDALVADARLRTLLPQRGADFASNDYLGFAQSPVLRDAAQAALARGVPVGAGGSRLLRGNHPEHEALEAEAAAHFGTERALFFANGSMANVALLTALPARDDVIVFDELIHASSHDGMRQSRTQTVRVAHNDPEAVADAIRLWRVRGGVGTAWIIVESLYSMDGDVAPLDDLLSVATDCDAVLIVDEAHATGAMGARGVGLAEAIEGLPNVITVHTFGKALGCEGAVVCGPAVVIDTLINRARSFIFTTAPSPLIAAVGRAALAHSATADEARFQLAARVAYADQQIKARLGRTGSGTHIQPIILGDNARTMAAAAACQAAGYDVRGIRPPTVAPGTARLRLSLTLNTSVADLDAVLSLLETLI